MDWCTTAKARMQLSTNSSGEAEDVSISIRRVRNIFLPLSSWKSAKRAILSICRQTKELSSS